MYVYDYIVDIKRKHPYIYEFRKPKQMTHMLVVAVEIDKSDNMVKT
jgi:hypothetical protein